jgi:DNA-binding SARP family transcriptional activator/tetratricopeptide (TPR) repeat protein
LGLIEIRTFGPGEIRADEGQNPDPLLAQPKRFAVLCYLALPKPGSMHRRDTLLGIFWPEVDQERSRMALRQALTHIRRNLGQEVLVRRGTEDIGLNPDLIWCDASAYDDAFEQARWEDAVELYRGEFLEGLSLPNAQEFRHWLEAERTRLAGRYAYALEELADAATADGRTRFAVRWWQMLVQHDQFNSRYGMQLMKALENDNDPANALLFARQHTELLKDEFGIAPPREFEVFIEEMRRVHAPAPELASQFAETAAHGEPGQDQVAEETASEPFPQIDLARNRPKDVLTGWRQMVAIGVAAILLMVVGAIAQRIIFDRGSTLDANRVIVLPFDNLTLDTQLDGLGFLTADWIGQALQRVGVAEIVPGTFARQYAEQASGAATNRVAQSVANQAGAGIVVCGSIYAMGDSLRYHVEVIDAALSRTLQNFEETWPRDQRVGALGSLGERVAGALAAELDPGLAKISRLTPTPPTLNAWRVYKLGHQLYEREEYAAAVEHHLAAYSLDTNFVRSVVAAGHAARDYFVKDSLARFAEQRRTRLSRAGQIELDILLALVAGDYDSARKSARDLAQLNPGGFCHVAQAMFALRVNRPREALQALESYDPFLDWRSDQADAYWLTLTEALHMIGDHEQELAEARKARELYPDRVDMLNSEAQALAALGRHDELESLLSQVTSMPNQPQMAYWEPVLRAGIELREHGHRDAQLCLDRAIQLLEQRPAPEAADAEPVLTLAAALYQAGRWTDAYNTLEQSSSLFANGKLAAHYLGLRGTAAARLGNEQEAVAICDSLSAIRHPYLHGDNLLQQAKVMALLGRTNESLQLLRNAVADGVGFGSLLYADVDLLPLHQRDDFRNFIEPGSQ